MLTKTTLFVALTLGLAIPCVSQVEQKSTPIELEVLKASVGVWDADIEVWPEGADSPSIKFKGVEKIRPYGQHWIASDFDSEYMGQTIQVHSIVGYDLDQQKLVGKVIDQGPYAATMTGEYDSRTKVVHWITEAKDPTGKSMIQKTRITHESDQERVLELEVPGDQPDEFKKFMQIRFVKRK